MSNKTKILKDNVQNLKIGSKVIFNTGNYAGLTGIVTNIDWESKHPNAIYTVFLSNGNVGHIEKSEHYKLVE